MPQEAIFQFSEEDRQLLDAYHLGRPTHIYRIGRCYKLFNRVSNIAMFLLLVLGILLAIGIIMKLIGQTNVARLWIWAGGLFLILAGGWYSLIICRHEEQSRRLIVGEDGLLEVRKMIKQNRIEVIYWTDIQAVKKVFLVPEYSVKCQRGQPFVLTPYVFQNGNELVRLIREHITE